MIFHTKTLITSALCRSQRGQGKAYSPAVQERQRAFQSLEASLSNQLDPIDWATYEPYLWANEATYYQRAATLFGALLQTQRLHTKVLPSEHCHALCSALLRYATPCPALLCPALPRSALLCCSRMTSCPSGVCAASACSQHVVEALLGNHRWRSLNGEVLWENC